MSSLSSNENSDSMSRAAYYAQQQLQHQQQLQYQQHQIQMQYQHQKQLLNHHNSSNTNQITNNALNYNINNTYSAASCANNYSQFSNSNIGPPQHFNSIYDVN